ncbi:Uncharacterised protein [Vibrio cholerae]|nr:Uncharacterised protein [Vibrio cholerae]
MNPCRLAAPCPILSKHANAVRIIHHQPSALFH